MKLLIILGLLFSIAGTLLTGLIAPGGIPKPGEIIRAPNAKLSCLGWCFLMFGFILQLLYVICE